MEAQPQLHHLFPYLSFPPRSPVPQLVEGNFALFCTYTLGFRNEFQNLLLAIMVRVGPRGWPKWLRLRDGSLDSQRTFPRLAQGHEG